MFLLLALEPGDLGAEGLWRLWAAQLGCESLGSPSSWRPTFLPSTGVEQLAAKHRNCRDPSWPLVTGHGTTPDTMWRDPAWHPAAAWCSAILQKAPWNAFSDAVCREPGPAQKAKHRSMMCVRQPRQAAGMGWGLQMHSPPPEPGAAFCTPGPYLSLHSSLLETQHLNATWLVSVTLVPQKPRTAG